MLYVILGEDTCADAERVPGTGARDAAFLRRCFLIDLIHESSPRRHSQRAPGPRPVIRNAPVVPASVTGCLRMKSSPVAGCQKSRESERDGERWMTERRQNYAVFIHTTGFMVDVIDASIPAVITVRDGGLFLITRQYFLLCISRSRDESTKMRNKGGGNPEDLQRQKHKNESFPHFFQSVLTPRLIVLLDDCADGLLTADAHQENCVNLTASDGSRPSQRSSGSALRTGPNI